MRSLIAQWPIASAPPEVAAAARVRRRPGPPPPGIDGGGRGRRSALVAGAIVLAVLAASGATAWAVRSRRDQGPSNVDQLAKVPSTNALAASPAQVLPGEALALHNRSSHAVQWRAEPTERWLETVPSSGRLNPGQTVQVLVRLLPDAPGGRAQAQVHLTGDDGSAAAVAVQTQVDRLPQVAATVDGCTVTATAEADGELSAVELHWLEATEQKSAMASDAQRYQAVLPATARRWWVVAVDGGGNQSQTAPEELAPGACAAPAS